MNDRPNPFVGPRSFRPGEELYGRDREAQELEDLIVAERIVLMYSPSGAGKTSLLHAKLLPSLKAARFRVRPVMRVSRPPANGAATVNRYVMSCLECLNTGEPEGAQKKAEDLAKLTLDEYLADPGKGEVLVFDQFEEILTLDPAGEDERRAFFDQLAECLKNRRRWALFSMREDYVAALDPYRKSLPTKLATTFRLDLLDKPRAIEAMRGPAAAAQVDFDVNAAAALADDLRRLRSTNAAPVYGPTVEPVQLQVVCYRLWQQIANTTSTITAEDLKSVAVDKALGDYYNDCIAGPTNPIEERHTREWFEDRLITREGNRAQVPRGPGQGIDDAIAKRLIDAYLVRAEGTQNYIWYELAHDRLIEPVLSSNADWRKAHPDLLRDQCALWLRNGRSDGMLLRGPALARAEQQVAGQELEPTEREFLETCRKERRRQRRERLLLVSSVALALIALAGFVYASIETRKARRQSRLATSTALASRAILVKDTQTDLASLLSVEGMRFASNFDSRNSLMLAAQANPNLLTTVAAGAATRAAVFDRSGNQLFTWGPKQLTVVNAHDVFHPAAGKTWDLPESKIAAFSSDGRLLAMGAPGVVRLWNLTDEPKAAAELKLAANRRVTAIAFNHNGTMLAAAVGGAQRVRLWDVANPSDAKPLGILEVPSEIGATLIGAVAFSPDGKTLAIAGGWQRLSQNLGWMALWDVTTPSQPRQLASSNGIYGDSAAFSQDGQSLAVGGANESGSGDTYRYGGGIELWNVHNPSAPVSQGIQWGSGKQRMTTVAFSQDGSLLLGASRWAASGIIHVFTVAATGQSLQPELYSLAGSEHAVTDLAFSSDGRKFATAGGRRVVFWNPPTMAIAAAPSPLVMSSVQAGGATVAVSPDQRTVATGFANGSVQLWTISTNGQLQQQGSPVSAAHQDTDAVVFSPDGKTLATSSPYEAVIRFWDVSGDGAPRARPIQIKAASNVFALAYSRDGKQLAAATQAKQIERWALEGNKARPLVSIPTSDFAASLEFSPDGRTIAANVDTGGSGRVMQFWDISGTSPRQIGALPQAIRVALSGDWKHAALATWDPPRLIMYHLNNLAKPEQGGVLGPLNWNIEDLAFDSNDDTLSSVDDQGGIQLWALHVVGPPKQLGETVNTTGKGSQLAFAANGRILLVTDGTNLMTVGIGVANFITRNCGRANRNLTQPEWNQNIGLALPYQVTCTALPPGGKPSDTESEE